MFFIFLFFYGEIKYKKNYCYFFLNTFSGSKQSLSKKVFQKSTIKSFYQCLSNVNLSGAWHGTWFDYNRKKMSKKFKRGICGGIYHGPILAIRQCIDRPILASEVFNKQSSSMTFKLIDIQIVIP